MLEATTDAEPGDMTEMTTELVEEFLLEDGDEGLENTEVNCHKCLKESFKFRKVSKAQVNISLLNPIFQELFCEKCLRKGLLDAAKVPQDNCKKCKKEKYFQKHSAYCEVKCQEYRAETEVQQPFSSEKN